MSNAQTEKMKLTSLDIAEERRDQLKQVLAQLLPDAVNQTKSTIDSDERRNKENQKIHCGKKHFESIGADFTVVTKLAEVNF